MRRLSSSTLVVQIPPPQRPGILRHGRSSSSGQSSLQGASFRALRFDASLSQTSWSAKARSSAARVLSLKRSSNPSRFVHKTRSINLLKLSVLEGIPLDIPASAPATVESFDYPCLNIDEEAGEWSMKDFFNVVVMTSVCGRCALCQPSRRILPHQLCSFLTGVG